MTISDHEANSVFPSTSVHGFVAPGLTKRELFAAKNMAALIGGLHHIDARTSNETMLRAEWIAWRVEASIQAADALLAALEKEQAK